MIIRVKFTLADRNGTVPKAPIVHVFQLTCAESQTHLAHQGAFIMCPRPGREVGLAPEARLRSEVLQIREVQFMEDEGLDQLIFVLSCLIGLDGA